MRTAAEESGHQDHKFSSTKAAKISPGIIARRHHANLKQVGFLREQYAEWKKVRL